MTNKYKIYGKRTIKVDNKNRIIIPAFAPIKDEEEIIPKFLSTKDVLILYSPEEYLEKWDLFKNILKEENMSFLDEKRWESYFTGELSYASEYPDKYRRIVLNQEILDTLQANSTLYAVARGNTLELYKDEDTYEEINNKHR